MKTKYMNFLPSKKGSSGEGREAYLIYANPSRYEVFFFFCMTAFNVYLEKALLCTQVVIQGFTLMGKCPKFIQQAKYSQGT